MVSDKTEGVGNADFNGESEEVDSGIKTNYC
jgi:hypothetical protein